MKLGKLAPCQDVRTLQFAKYMKTAQLPPAPSSCDWSHGITSWGMMRNDIAGDCTCAGAGHMIMAWTANVKGSPTVISDDDVTAAYSAVSGYDPATGANDNGAVEVNVLNYWRKNGIGGHKILAYAAVNTRNIAEVQLATYLFGGLYLGIALPLTAQSQLNAGKPWTASRFRFGQAQPGSWGGHCVPLVSYAGDWFSCVTWSKIQKMNSSFFTEYVDEAYAIIAPEWFDDQNQCPAGFDLAALQTDLQAIAA